MIVFQSAASDLASDPNGFADIFLRFLAPRGELSGDNAINAVDQGILLQNWGERPCSAADFNLDGDVGPADLAQLLAHWTG